MSSIIDFHTHFFSHAYFEALAKSSPLAGGTNEKIQRVTAQAGIERPSPEVGEHTAKWVAELDRFGVKHAVSFASVPDEAQTVLRATSMAAGRLSALGVVDPGAPEAPERVEDWLEHGLKGVVLFPALHGFRLDGPEAARVFGVLARHEALAVVHCGLLQVPLRERFGLPRCTDLTLADPLHLVPAASAHPRVRFVVPHFGAGFFRETLMLGKQCENVLVDTSSSNAWIATQPAPLSLADVFERTLGVFGPERILFGTDSSVFPRGWRHDILTAQREALGANGVSEQDRRKILFGNAARVLRLDA